MILPTPDDPHPTRFKREDPDVRALRMELFALRRELAAIILDVRPGRPRRRVFAVICKLEAEALAISRPGRRRG